MIALLGVAWALDCDPSLQPGLLPAQETLWLHQLAGAEVLLVDGRVVQGLEGGPTPDALTPVAHEVLPVEDGDGLELWSIPPLDPGWSWDVVGPGVRRTLRFDEGEAADVVVPELDGRRVRRLGLCTDVRLELSTGVERAHFRVVQVQHASDPSFEGETLSWWVEGEHLSADPRRIRGPGYLRARTLNARGEVSAWSETADLGCACGSTRGGVAWGWVVLALWLRRRPRG